MTRPNVLLESWLPFDIIGAESMRERGASSALPPLYFLHVWWARRPLTISRAAIVASLLPSWEQLQEALSPPPAADAATPSPLPISGEGRGPGGGVRAAFPTEEAYHAWFLRLMGIHGDPVTTRKRLLRARETGENLGPNPYGYPRAFTANPTPEDLTLLEKLLALTWGDRNRNNDLSRYYVPDRDKDCSNDLSRYYVLDPFAGGGSIPFEARRYGFAAVANELNPVAAVILKATLDYPAHFGPDLAADIKHWGQEWAKRVSDKLASFFPKGEGENIFAYLWARTVACPITGKPVPLSPNWWLSKKKTLVAARLLADPAWDEPRFEIVVGETIDFDPNEGTVSRGVGRSPWTGETVDGDYIKAEAQAGRMGQMLYAIAVKRRGGFDFRAPTPEDLEAFAAAEAELARKRPLWEAQDLIPTESIPDGLKTPEPMRYGMYTWAAMFSPRQLLALGTFAEVLRDLRDEMRPEMDTERAAAVETYLAFALDKAADRNAYQTRWISQRHVIANTFDRHDFAMKWSFAEFDAAGNLVPWGVSQIVDAYEGIARLLALPQTTLDGHAFERGPLTVFQGSASDISSLPDGSVYAVVTDPPYYDNVMYAELADFFYVWLKRTAGHLYPEWFAAQLTDKDAEAVANPARFKGVVSPSPRVGRGGQGARALLSPSPRVGRGGQEVRALLSPSPRVGRGGRGVRALAEKDYERKMAAAFREMHRVLRDDGVLTVMFTHKRVEAWDTLAAALIGAGFSIETSWPVPTEFEHSLHQAKKNAARSTILLACRKRVDKETRGQGDKETVPPHSHTPTPSSPVWWDDIQPRVRQVAREKAAEFAERGIKGVDLYLSTFGPVLSVISQHWPVLTSEVDERTGEPKPLRPETALDLAREEVIRLRKRGLLLGREVQFDPTTDWYLMAWDAFRAERFPADEARKLALALGLDVEGDLVTRRVVSKKGSDVILLPPRQRRGRGKADPDADHFNTWLDAVHTTMLVYAEDGAPACETFLKRAGLRNDGTFKACLQAMLNAIPRTQIKGQFVRPEAEVLDRLRLAFFEELEAPVEEDVEAKPEQMRLM